MLTADTRRAAALLAAALATALLAGAGGAAAAEAGGAGGSCGAGAWRCLGGGCARADQYCDGRAHCADASDEPPRCTPCNRTLQGDPHTLYSVAVWPPGGTSGGGVQQPAPAPPTPFLCHLTFSARGGLVQLAFAEFSVGRHEAAGAEPCPDGQVSLAELGRPYTGGAWCGAAPPAPHAPALYFSETATVTLSVRLWRARLGEPFALRLDYRFIPQQEAVVRYGASGAGVERGAAAPGTYCTRTFSECHKRSCKLQSPNYPGMYPRNVSCYWTLWQKDIPTCKHAMISIQQDIPFKIQIKRSVSMARLNKTRRWVRAWGACGAGGDRVLVYDGASTDDPLLLEWCGGAALPAVTARGPAMLVAFHAAPRAAPPAPAPAGFELDVRVVFADADSLEYAREPRRCEFHVKAGGARRGVLRAPAHTLPPNTTCTWTFHGQPGDLVWIYFASFSEYSLVEPKKESETEETSPPVWTRAPPTTPASPWSRLRELLRAAPASSPARLSVPGPGAAGAVSPAPCAVPVRVWDASGELHAGCGAGRLCARASLANATRAPRPCSPPDGYVSRGPLLSLAVTSLPGTATHPLHFVLHYEFADTRLPGSRWEGASARAVPAECARVVRAEGAVWSPRSPLWLGRGGARRLRCVTRLEPGAGRARLELHAVSLGAAPRCTTRPHPHTARPACYPLPAPAPPDGDADPGAERPPHSHHTDTDDEDASDIDKALRSVPHIKIYEVQWPGYKVEVACFCDNMTWVAENSSAKSTESNEVASLAATTSAPAVAGAAGPLVLEGAALEVVLWGGAALSAREDAQHVQYRGAWRRLPAPPYCASRAPPPSPSGRLRLARDACAHSPYLLRVPPPLSLFVRAPGVALPLEPPLPAAADADPAPLCHTPDRLLIYEAHTGRLMKAVCPSEEDDDGSRSVQVFTPEWWGGGGGGREGAAGAVGRERALLVVWEARGGGEGAVSWLQVWRAPAAGADNVSCPAACPELEACIPAAAWCDGSADCPRGGDEAGGCGRLLARLAGAWRAAAWGGAGAAAAGGVLALLLVAVLWAVARRRRAARHKRARAGGAGAGGGGVKERLVGSSAASRASTPGAGS